MQEQRFNERRRVQRVALGAAVPATVAGLRVDLLELSNSGARIEHEAPFAVRREMKIRFEHGDDSFELSCEVVRCRLQRSTARPGSVAYSSGLRFTDSTDRSREQVRLLVARMLGNRAGERGEENRRSAAV